MPEWVGAALPAKCRRCLEANDAIRYEEPSLVCSEETWWLTQLAPVRNEAGRIVQIIGSSVNITELKRVEQELRESDELLRKSEEKYRALFEEAFDGLFITSPEGVILDINRNGVIMFGYDTKEEVLVLDLERDVYASPTG